MTTSTLRHARDMSVEEIANSIYGGLLALSKDTTYGDEPDMSDPWIIHMLRFPGIQGGQMSEADRRTQLNISYTIERMSEDGDGRLDKAVMWKICQAMEHVIASDRFKGDDALVTCEDSLRVELALITVQCW